jgi:hypothetical protein
MFWTGMRLTDWTFAKGPLQRRTPSTKSVWANALDLVLTVRGLDWTWSGGTSIPREYRPTSSPYAFLWATAVQAVKHTLITDGLHYALQLWDPNGIGSPTGGSIWYPSLSRSLPLQYLGAVATAGAGGVLVYHIIQAEFMLGTLTLYPILPSKGVHEWPPLFDAPWRAQSLIELWGCRWHQMMRREFVAIGAKPFALVFGRTFGLLGAFVASGLLHNVGLWGMGQGGDGLRMFGYFVIMGVGCVAEVLWMRFTGKKVCGWLGRLWTFGWLLAWSPLLVEPWFVRGLVGSHVLPPHLRGGKMIVDWICKALWRI